MSPGGGTTGMWNSPTLDRIDNAAGYVPGNIVVVSYMANSIKTNATPEQVLAVGQFYSALKKQRNRRKE